MKRNTLNTFLSTLNFVLMFIGYQLATSLFLPVTSNIEGISRTVTLPYRAFALLIGLWVIFLNFKVSVGKVHIALKLFWIYWIALIIRIFYDTELRIDVHVNDTTQLWLLIFGMCIIPMYSLMKTHKYINYHKAFIWIYVGSFITLVLSLFNNPTLLSSAEEITQRAGGNLAFNSIAFGHLGTTGVIMSLFILSKYEKMSIVTKVLVIGIMLLSFFVMLRAGSRSPIVALFVVLIFWLFARGKNIVLGTTVSLIALFLIVIFMDQILGFIGDISPVMEFRLRASIYEGDSSGRDPIFETAFQAFLDKPILGKQFAMFDNGDFGYSHNLILDSLMGLGIFGGLAIVYILWIAIKKSYYFVKNKDTNYWISLILIQQIVLSMLSGAIYYSQLINVLLVFVFISNYSKTQTLFSNQ